MREEYCPSDLTGGMVWEEGMEKVVLNPTKNNAKEFMLSVIYYAFGALHTHLDREFGCDLYPEDDKFVYYLHTKYIRHEEIYYDED